MLKEISKKLTMKKTFFTTQLEGFFNSISQEYQEAIHKIELEKRALEERIADLEKDVKNLVEIKKAYENELKLDKSLISEYKSTLDTSSTADKNSYTKKLEDENLLLKEELKKTKLHLDKNEEVESLKDQIKKLQAHLAKGISAYNDNISRQKSEEIIKEIKNNISK